MRGRGAATGAGNGLSPANAIARVVVVARYHEGWCCVGCVDGAKAWLWMRLTWFRPGEVGWDPRGHEFYFSRTRTGRASRARETRAVVPLLRAVLRPDDRVLDVGSGTGYYTIPIARYCAAVDAVDVEPAMRAFLRKRLEREGLTNVTVRAGRLPGQLGAPESFDGALSMGVLQYMPDLDIALGSLAAVVKPGGWLVWSVQMSTLEGRVYWLTEVLSRRRAYLRSPAEVTAAAARVGLCVDRMATAGITRQGLTLVAQATKQTRDAPECQPVPALG